MKITINDTVVDMPEFCDKKELVEMFNAIRKEKADADVKVFEEYQKVVKTHCAMSSVWIVLAIVYIGFIVGTYTDETTDGLKTIVDAAKDRIRILKGRFTRSKEERFEKGEKVEVH